MNTTKKLCFNFFKFISKFSFWQHGSFVSSFRLFLMVESRGYSPLRCLDFSAVVPTVEQGLKSVRASVAVAHGLSWVDTCEVFPEQGWNLCLLPWQAVSLLLDHQGSPCCLFNSQFILIRIQSRSANCL